MKTINYTILLFCFFLVSAGLAYTSIDFDRVFATQNVNVQEDSDGIWRVQDNNGKNKGRMDVSRKDKVNWHVKGSDMEFRFRKDVNAYFNYESGMFVDGKTQIIENYKKLEITLKDDAPADTLVYDIYVVDADTFVVGNSPPILIIN